MNLGEGEGEGQEMGLPRLRQKPLKIPVEVLWFSYRSGSRKIALVYSVSGVRIPSLLGHWKHM